MESFNKPRKHLGGMGGGSGGGRVGEREVGGGGRIVERGRESHIFNVHVPQITWPYFSKMCLATTVSTALRGSSSRYTWALW